MRRINLEAFKMAPKKAKSVEEGDKAFSWTDDELSLLLKVIIDYKAYKEVCRPKQQLFTSSCSSRPKYITESKSS